MLIEKVEHFKEWLTNALAPICEADAGALAKYVVALVKKDRPVTELKDTCVDQLDVFLQTKTRDFVETLFEALNNKTYVKPEPEPEEEPKPVPVPDTTDSLPEFPPVETENQQPTAGTPVEDELKPAEEETKEAVPAEEPKRILSRSRSPRNNYRPRDDDRRRRYDDRRPYDRDRGYPRRRSISPRDLRHRVTGTGRGRSRSPLRRRSPFRPIQRSRSPRMRGRGRGRSRSRSLSRSLSPRKSWSRSRSRDRFRSRSRSLPLRSKSRSPRREVRPPRLRSRSPGLRSRSPRPRSRSPRYWSPRKRSRSPGDRSPRSRSRTPLSRGGSKSPRRSRSLSPPRKVRRHSSNSRGPTPTEENGLADSTNVRGSPSNISVVTLGGRYDDDPPTGSRLRCRDFDEKGFCVRGDLCMFDHGADPVIVEKYNMPPFPPGMQGPRGPPPGHPGGPPMGMNVPPPGFMPRMPGMAVRGPRPGNVEKIVRYDPAGDQSYDLPHNKQKPYQVSYGCDHDL